jgi:hypothetical protein
MAFGTFFAPNFGKRSGAHRHPGFRPEQFLPPMAPGPGQVNFDYSPLFIAEALVMDREAFEVLVSSESPLPPHALEQLKALHDEGFIRLEEFTLSANELSVVREATAAELPKGQVWDLPVCRSINWWLDAGRHFGSAFKDNMDRLGGLPYLLTEFQAQRGIYYDLRLGRSLWRRVRRAKKSDPLLHEEVMAELRGFLLDYVHTNLVLAKRFSSTNYEWHNYQPALTQKLKFSEDPGRTLQADFSPRALVEATVPCDFPWARTSQAIRLLKDRRVRNVREVLRQSLEFHGGINDALRRDFQRAVYEANHISARRRTFGYFMAPLGFFLGLPGLEPVIGMGGAWIAETVSGNASAITGMIQEGAELVIGEAVDAAVVARMPNRKKLEKAAMTIYRHCRSNSDKLL